MRIIQGLRPQDVAAEALPEAVHTAFFGGLAGGKGGVGGAAGDGNDGGVLGGRGEVFGGVGFGAVGGKGGRGEGTRVNDVFSIGVWVDANTWRVRGGEAAFRVLVFEAFDHAGEGRIEEMKTFWQATYQ